jgi:hypothetical protein
MTFSEVINLIIKRRKLVIAVDFDGTIVKNEWPEIGRTRWFAFPVLRWMKKRGHILILYTCRENLDLDKAILFLIRNNLKYPAFDYINENCKELIKKFGDARKIGADLYIDDLGAGFWIWPIIPMIVWLKERRRNDGTRNKNKMRSDAKRSGSL